jgi:hypothetical protein
MSDILEMRKDYLDNHQECNTSVKSWEQMDEHERLDCKMLQHQARMRGMLVQGRLSIDKYQAWARKLQNSVVITEEDETADMGPVDDSGIDDDDDDAFEQLMQLEGECDAHTRLRALGGRRRRVGC